MLYLALEDGPRRLKDRMELVEQPYGRRGRRTSASRPPGRCCGDGGLERLEDGHRHRTGSAWCGSTPCKRVRGPRRTKDTYGEDYEVMAALHDIGRSHPGLGLVVVHHNRKDDRPDDYIDALSGSTGMTGAVDTSWCCSVAGVRLTASSGW